MTREDRTKALTAIEQFEKSGGGAWRRRTANRLRRTLEKRPEEFWDCYLSVMNPPSEDTVVLIKSGKVTPETTFDQLGQILKKERDAR